MRFCIVGGADRKVEEATAPKNHGVHPLSLSLRDAPKNPWPNIITSERVAAQNNYRVWACMLVPDLVS